jgi:hypothetical protein
MFSELNDEKLVVVLHFLAVTEETHETHQSE